MFYTLFVLTYPTLDNGKAERINGSLKFPSPFFLKKFQLFARFIETTYFQLNHVKF